MEAEDERTSITASDVIITLSFLLLTIGVFVIPLSCSECTGFAANMFGTALVLFAATPFVLFGHYNLYPFGDQYGRRPWITKQERVALVLLVPFVAAILFWIWF